MNIKKNEIKKKIKKNLSHGYANTPRRVYRSICPSVGPCVTFWIVSFFCITAPAQPSAMLMPCIQSCFFTNKNLKVMNKILIWCPRYVCIHVYTLLVIFLFLVADTRLYTLPCWLVGRSIRPSVRLSHFWIPGGFHITAPAQPSATVLPCIWPC